uniref:AAA family ATPase n=1 Tax=Steinernema glaseri TaxID=37863 RepID=A0A1I8A7B5_9BILA
MPLGCLSNMFETEGTPPPNDFRMESVVPTKEDLLFDGEPYLRKNIVKGPYDDAEHYLDVHFRLLREDSLRVLRDGVRQYRQHGYKPRKKVTEAIVYKNVRIGMPVSVEDGGMVSEAKFRARICNSVRQLMHGSLVVLSNDNFAKNFLFATVYHRNRLDLDAGYVTLEFFMNQGPVDYSSQYQIMESPAFFEAYRHVLRGLQSFARGEDIPLSKYLIKLNTSPGLPSYFQEARTFDMDFSILSDERRSWIVDVREAHEIVTPDDIGLDPSQQKALMMALQQELAVIQGPPGTGKTYLGHQICRLLLANQRLWNSDRRHPMLVRHMVRVGTRCHNPDFKPYMLNEIRRHHKDRFSRDLNAQRRKIQEERREIVEKIGEISTDLAMASNGVMPIDKLIIPKERVISKDHEEEFMLQRSDGFTVYTLGEVFFHWLADEHRPADVEHDILEAEPFTEEDVACITDIYKMPLYKRWRLYSYWMVRFRVKKERQLQELQTQYDNLTRRMAELRQRQDLEILKSARVIGMTTTGAARLQSILATIQCPIVIVEEAAEVFEAHIVTALTVHCKHVILIGDHKQLRPTPEVYDLGRQFHLDVSLFERLMKNNFPYVMLQYQHRMRPEISQAVMPLFYDNLRDDPSVRRYPPVAGMDKNFVFINHHSPEENSEALVSHLNKYEGEYAVRIALYLLHQGYLPQQIAIITPYVEQMMYIRRRADELICRGNGVRIEAVDSYQGEESDLVILSLVRSLNPEGKIGFLRVQNRVCVAMSRAKMGLYVLGNIDFLADDCELWDRMKTTLENRGVLSNVLPIVCQDHGRHQDITIWRDFAKAAAEGGCFEPCDFRLDCGHACNRLCHPTPHDDVDCTEPCARACPVGHPCDKLCSDPCGDCMQDVPVDLPCGHRSTKPCYTTYRPVPCDQRCLKTFPCGHQCQKTCSEPCPTVCHELVQKRFKCGHSAEMACSDDVSKGRCGGKSMKRWSACGHEIEADCWLDPAKIPCPHPCGMTLTDCKHTCKGTCGGCRQGRLHIRCEERCKRILFCGHPCTSTCSGVCPPCDRTCETECFHSRCAVPSNGSTKKKVSFQ